MMINYLCRHAVELWRKDGPLTVIQEGIKYIGLYNTPPKLAKWWLTKAAGVGYVVRNVQGSRMLLDLRDKGIHRDLYLHGIREPQATRYLQTILKPDWSVVDIGANVGYYAMQEARRVKDVIAIEPTPDSYQTILTNIALNGYTNITPMQLAVGDVEGQIGFDISAACNWNKISRGEGDMKVPVTTLDKLLGDRRVDYVRMDVEGYEMRILQGMQSVIDRCHPGIFIEVHRDMLVQYGSSQLELMEFLGDYGYHLSQSFVMGREGPRGKITTLMADPHTRREITERGIASHMFFSMEEVA